MAAPYNIGDAHLAAEGYRLIAEHLNGGKQLLSLTQSSTPADTRAVAVRSGQHYYVYFVNTGANTMAITLRLSNWGVGAGVPVVVERMGAATYGEVASVLTTGTGGVLTGVVSGEGWGGARARGGPVSLRSQAAALQRALHRPLDRSLLLPLQSAGPDTLLRIRVPAAAVTQASLAATHAVHVRAGTNKGVNYGTLATMCVGSAATTTIANTWAGVMQFTVPTPATVTSAVRRRWPAVSPLAALRCVACWG